MRVGLVGLGRMGSALAPRLASGCEQLTVWNRTRAKCEDAAAAGAQVAPSLALLVNASDIVLSILFDDAAVIDTYLGTDGLLSQDCTGRVFVEMSTIKPQTIREIARVAEEKGASLVDAPVSGTVGPAREGKLLVLTGGSAPDVSRVTPVLSLFARRIVHLGPTGSGSSMKLALQLPLYAYWQALGEALSLGTAEGLGMAEMLSVIADSPAAIGMLQAKLPVLLGEDEDVAFALSAALKDLTLIADAGREQGLRMPCAEMATDTYRLATEQNWGGKDVARVVNYLAGTPNRLPRE